MKKEPKAMPKLTKKTRISREQKRLASLFATLPDAKLQIVGPLCEEAAFMRVTLEDLREEINANGCTEEYKNGSNQNGLKQTAAMQAYNSLIKQYSNVSERLERSLPTAAGKSRLAAFMGDLSDE